MLPLPRTEQSHLGQSGVQGDHFALASKLYLQTLEEGRGKKKLHKNDILPLLDTCVKKSEEKIYLDLHLVTCRDVRDLLLS